MNKLMNKMNIIFSGVMLLIGLVLTGSYIAMAMDAKNMVNIVKEEMNITDEHRPEFSLLTTR